TDAAAPRRMGARRVPLPPPGSDRAALPRPAGAAVPGGRSGLAAMTAGAAVQARPVARSRRMLADTVYLAGLTYAVLLAMLRPSTWRGPVREVLVRQVYFTGVQALGSVAWVAILVGLGVVLQTRLWLSQFGQTALLGPVLVVVVVRELSPLLVN